MAQQPNPKIASEPCSVCGKRNQSYSTRQMRNPPAERKCLDCMNTARELGPDEQLMTKQEAGGFNVPKLKTSDDPCCGCGFTGVLFSTREAKKRPGHKRCIDCMEEIKRQRIELFGAFPGQEVPQPRHTNIMINEDTVTDDMLVHRMETEMARERKLEQPSSSADPGSATAGCFQDLPKPQLADEPCSQCLQYGMAFSKRQMALDPEIRRCLSCMNNGNVPGQDGKVVANMSELVAAKVPEAKPAHRIVPPPKKVAKVEPKIIPALPSPKVEPKIIPARRVQVNTTANGVTTGLMVPTIDGWLDKDQVEALNTWNIS